MSRTIFGIGAAIVLAIAGLPNAQAAILDLELPTNLEGPAYSQDGYTILSSSNSFAAYGNWIVGGSPSFNAGGSNATMFQRFAFSPNTITNDLNQPFSFTSIGLASFFNGAFPGALTGGDVKFTFNHIGGGSNEVTVSLLEGVVGLQTFSFDEHFLINVIFQPLTTQFGVIQFDNIGLSVDVSQTPLPAALPLFGSALGLMGFVGWWRKRRGEA